MRQKIWLVEMTDEYNVTGAEAFTDKEAFVRWLEDNYYHTTGSEEIVHGILAQLEDQLNDGKTLIQLKTNLEKYTIYTTYPL